jgi:hypothetical protein
MSTDEKLHDNATFREGEAPAEPLDSSGDPVVAEIVPEGHATQPRPARGTWKAIERALERLGDRLNPILVKETRQALKSRQFLITFALLLFLGWGWSILGIAMIGPAAWVATSGATMFVGYFIILAFPLLIVVPFGAFRSLAAEQETRTFELLSITALGTRQIVVGKLGSAILQMSVYLSAVSPCLGFTYLLRGIDVVSIFFLLFWLVLASLGLSAIALLMATITPKRHLQVIPMVVSMLGLFVAFIASIFLSVEFMESGAARTSTSWEFWAVNAGFVTAFAGYFLMICEAAAARLSFASDNRSSRLRAIMVLHQMLFTGWMVIPWLVDTADADLYLAFMIPAGLQWYFLGTLMIGESTRLSGRVKRQLPQSFLGRAFLTWFYPGPASGYALAFSGLLCSLATVIVGACLDSINGWRTPRYAGATALWDNVIPFGILGLSYIVIYLGLGLLVVRTLRRVTSAGLLMSAITQIVLLLLGCVVPLVIQWTSPQLRYLDYSLLQVTNPLWSLAHVLSRPALSQTSVLLAIVPLAAVVVLLLNLPGMVREVRNIRIIKPKRVLEEDAALAAAGQR